MKYVITVDIDVTKLCKVTGGDIDESIESEMGWLSDSGIFYVAHDTITGDTSPAP